MTQTHESLKNPGQLSSAWPPLDVIGESIVDDDQLEVGKSLK